MSTLRNRTIRLAHSLPDGPERRALLKVLVASHADQAIQSMDTARDQLRRELTIEQVSGDKGTTSHRAKILQKAMDALTEQIKLLKKEKW